MICCVIECYIVDKELSFGYEYVYMFVFGSKDLYEILGYWEYYQDGMFLLMEMDNEMFVFCLMNCFYYMMIYKQDIYSYCEFLICIVEFGMMYCYEMLGVFLGFQCVCGMMLNDVYIFVCFDQIKEEFICMVCLI